MVSLADDAMTALVYGVRVLSTTNGKTRVRGLVSALIRRFLLIKRYVVTGMSQVVGG
jgi:hypothetical protein